MRILLGRLWAQIPTNSVAPEGYLHLIPARIAVQCKRVRPVPASLPPCRCLSSSNVCAPFQTGWSHLPAPSYEWHPLASLTRPLPMPPSELRRYRVGKPSATWQCSLQSFTLWGPVEHDDERPLYARRRPRIRPVVGLNALLVLTGCHTIRTRGRRKPASDPVMCAPQSSTWPVCC